MRIQSPIFIINTRVLPMTMPTLMLILLYLLLVSMDKSNFSALLPNQYPKIKLWMLLYRRHWPHNLTSPEKTVEYYLMYIGIQNGRTTIANITRCVFAYPAINRQNQNQVYTLTLCVQSKLPQVKCRESGINSSHDKIIFRPRTKRGTTDSTGISNIRRMARTNSIYDLFIIVRQHFRLVSLFNQQLPHKMTINGNIQTHQYNGSIIPWYLLSSFSFTFGSFIHCAGVSVHETHTVSRFS